MKQPHLPPPVPTDEPGARAIEIAAMLGDSVIDVRHLQGQSTGKTSRATYGLAAAAAVLLSLSAFAFAAGVKNASANQRAYERWVDIEQRSALEFRPERLGLGFDWLAFGGAIGGIACAAAALIRYRRDRVPSTFSIGRAAGVDFPTDDAPADSFELVAPVEGGFALHVAPGMSAVQLSGADAQPVEKAETIIPTGARYRVEVGQQAFLIASVPAPRRQAVPVFGTWDRAVLGCAAVSLVAHLALIAMLSTVPPDQSSLGDDDTSAESRYRMVRLPAAEDPATKEKETLDGTGGEEPAGTAGAKMALAEGAMGEQTAKRPTGRYAMEKRTDNPQLAKEAEDLARRGGTLGVFVANQRMWRSMTGTADLSSGLDPADVRGGLTGYEIAESYGGWGYGVKGVGPGAGGTHWGTIGTSNYGLIGHGPHGPGGYGPGGPGGAPMRKRQPKGPDIVVGPVSSNGELDKNTIRRYIRLKLPRIRHCYEKELVVKPELNGTVLVTFQISPTGVVQGATAVGMDKGVEGCVAEAVSSIQFPKPKGGGMVNVRYPFIFNPAGQ